MSETLYRLALVLARPLVRARLNWRARKEPEYGQRIEERFGRVPESIGRDVAWFHTVSAGETIAAAPLIRTLADEFDGRVRCLVTTMTPTGSQQVTERLGDIVDHCYAPYDFSDAVTSFFDRVRPRILVLMETELWPNLLAEAARRDVPVLLINARLSERSTRGYAKLGALTRRMMSQLAHVGCQTPEHRDRFVGLGLEAQRVTVTGSVKYDVALPEDSADRTAALRACFGADRSLWIAASTHPGEDEIVLDCHARLRERFPGLGLVLVPRHPVRTEEVLKLIVSHGFSAVRQSELSSPSDADILLGDVMGSLLDLYGLAEVAYVGGSLVDVGGHNPIEPALHRIPLVCGPFQFNFAEAMDSLSSAGAMRTITSADDMARAVGDWLGNDCARRDAGSAAFQVVEANRGAEAKTLALVRDVLGRVAE